MSFITIDTIIYKLGETLTQQCLMADKSMRSIKIAAFDLDGTLVPPFVKNLYFLYDINNLKKAVQDGYSIFIISNQKKRSVTVSPHVLGRLTTANEMLIDNGIYATFLVATADDKYRKPSTGLLEFFKEIMPNIEKFAEDSFFVGDAAGRPNDFSDSDSKFAENANLRFYTPEEYFTSKVLTG